MKANESVVIVDGYSTGRHLAPRLRQLGVRCFHVQSEPQINEFDVDSFCAEDYENNFVFEGDLGALLSKIRKVNPFFVVGGSESGVILADSIAHELGLPGNDISRSEARRNKYLMQKALDEHGVEGPKTLQIASTAELLELMKKEELAFPVVIKPKDSAGTDGVHICQTINDACVAAKGLLGKRNAMNSINDKILLQEMLVGPQYIVNTISVDGEHITTEIWQDVRQHVAHGIAYCYEQLMDIEGEIQEQLSAYTHKVLDALGVKEGPAHHEVVLTSKGLRLIEVGCRLQGSIDPEVIEDAIGYSHVSLTAGVICARRKVSRPVRFKTNHSKVRCVSLISKVSGKILELRNVDKLEMLSSFRSIFSIKKPGEFLHQTVDLATNPGILYLVHPDESQLAEDYERIRDLEVREGFFTLA